MPRYRESREQFPIVITLQLNEDYIKKLDWLQKYFGFQGQKYKRSQTIRRCIDDTYARYFVPDTAPE